MESLLAPASPLTTLVCKPIWMFRVIAAAVPFFIANRYSVIKPRILAFHEALREDPDTSEMKIGSAGFCWGGLYTIELCQGGGESQLPPLVDAGFVAHPSGVKIPGDFERVKVPLSVAVGDVDLAMKVELAREAKAILEKRGGQRHEVIIYPGAKHGFAVRANVAEARQAESSAGAEAQARAWFERWLN